MCVSVCVCVCVGVGVLAVYYAPHEGVSAVVMGVKVILSAAVKPQKFP